MQFSENPPQPYNILQDKTMENSSLYYSSHLGARSTPHRQRDRSSSAAPRLDDFQTMHNISLNNYLSPIPNSFYNAPVQPDNYVMGTEKNWSWSPGCLNVSRTSITTSLLCSEYVPLRAEFRVRDPLHDIDTNDRGLREQLGAYSNGYQPTGFQSQGIAHRRNYPTDAPPFNQVTPQRPSNVQHIGSQPAHRSGENVRPAAPTRQASSTGFDFDYAVPPQPFGHSYVSNPVAVPPRANSEHCEPSTNPIDSSIFTTCYPIWNVPKDIKTESLDAFTPSHHPCNVSDLSDIESPTPAPIPHLQHRRRRRRNPTATRSKAVDPLDTASSPCPTLPHFGVAGNVDSLTTLTPSRPIKRDPNLTYPQPSHDSVENQDDPDEFLRYITTLYDDTQPLGGDCHLVDLGAPDLPIVKKEDVSDASEPGTAQHSAGQPVEDARSEQKAAPQGRKRKRSTSDAIKKETEQHQQAKKPRKPNPNSTPRKASNDYRRKHLTSRFFCVDQECHASRDPHNAFDGFKTKEDANRHLLIHEPGSYFCPKRHVDSQPYCAKRADNLRE